MERFWSKVDASGDCWLWTAADRGNGYGVFRSEGQNHSAHRFAWSLLMAPVPDGLELDHLCRQRLCVNPDHLEPVTHQENQRRALGRSDAMPCRNGHEGRWSRTGRSRRCLECRRIREANRTRQKEYPIATILELTDRLLAATGHGPLPEFIAKHADLEPSEVQIELYKATGQMYDRRTIKNWMARYGRS